LLVSRADYNSACFQHGSITLLGNSLGWKYERLIHYFAALIKPKYLKSLSTFYINGCESIETATIISITSLLETKCNILILHFASEYTIKGSKNNSGFNSTEDK
jgi:hypothetical protein